MPTNSEIILVIFRMNSEEPNYTVHWKCILCQKIGTGIRQKLAHAIGTKIGTRKNWHTQCLVINTERKQKSDSWQAK